jgi:restriction system protein
MNRRRFEHLVAELFNGFGYEVELTKQTRDGGKDIIAVKRAELDLRFLIECKRPDPGDPIGVSTVRELYGVKVDDGATKAILATTTHFTPDAVVFSERNKWELELKDYDAIKEWITKYLGEK